MATKLARAFASGRRNGLSWVPADASGFNLPAPFTVPSFGTVVTPNLALVAPARDFWTTCQATNPNLSGTHVWCRFYLPTTQAFAFEFEINEFIDQDGYGAAPFGLRCNRGPVWQTIGSMPYLVGMRFDNFDALDVTVLHFDGLFCSW